MGRLVLIIVLTSAAAVLASSVGSWHIDAPKVDSDWIVRQGRSLTISADSYSATTLANGSLEFSDQRGTILNPAPLPVLNYGQFVATELGVPNSSFEKNLESGIPADWEITPPEVGSSMEQASSGTHALKFSLPSVSSQHHWARSSVIRICTDCKYSIGIDSLTSAFGPGTGSVGYYVDWFYDASGKGTKETVFLRDAPTEPRSKWETTRMEWSPPGGARAFRIQIFASKNTIGVIYFDNISVAEERPENLVSGLAEWTLDHQDAASVVLSATDNGNQDVTIKSSYQLGRHSPFVKYTLSLVYKRDVSVFAERADFEVASAEAAIMTRDLAMKPLDATRDYWSDFYTPKVIRFNRGFALFGSDDAQSMRVEVQGDKAIVSMYIDSAIDHPHAYYVVSAEGGSSSLIPTNESSRRRGESSQFSVTFAVGSSPTWLVKSRLPSGFMAALAMTEHADQDSLSRAMALAYGTDDVTSVDFGKKGFVGNHLAWTKSVFPLNGNNKAANATLEDRPFKAFIDKLSTKGVEIVPHSVVPNGRAPRDLVIKGLDVMRRYQSRNWIDHGAAGGVDHWEDLASKGAIRDSGYYIVDLLHQFGYRYAWSYIDYPIAGQSLNMLAPEETGAARPILWHSSAVDPTSDPRRQLFLYATVNTLKMPDVYLAPPNIDELIQERGIHISHDYYDIDAAEGHTWQKVNGSTTVTPSFEKALEYIASQRDAGLLWVPTVSQLADYLLSSADVRIDYNDDGTYTIVNKGPTAIIGLTLLAEKPLQAVRVRDGADVSRWIHRQTEVIVPQLLPNTPLTLEILQSTK